MINHKYRCSDHGSFLVRGPQGNAPDTVDCATCGEAAPREYPIMVQRISRDRIAAIDRAEKSREAPEVVSSLPRRHPSKRTPQAPPNPVLQKLPRPRH